MATDASPKSFRDLARTHGGFFVHPAQWTSRHLDLVGCQFEEVATASVSVYTEVAQNDDGDQKSCPKPKSDAELVATSLPFEIKRRHLIKILVGKDRAFAHYRKGAPFYFQGRPVHYPDYIIFQPHKQCVDRIHNIAVPVGYVHYSCVIAVRRKRFYPCLGPNGTDNPVCERIWRIRQSQIKPKEWTKDPYFVCHLLALAQRQERKLDSSKQTTHTSRLLMTNMIDREYIHLYEAEITTELLNSLKVGLKDSKDAKAPVKWPTIWHKKIPYKPYRTFADRLVAELEVPKHLPSSRTLNSQDNVNTIIRYSMKLPYEQQNYETCRVGLVS